MQKQQKIVVGGRTYVPLKCQRCKWAWLYQGKGDYRTSCPRCLTNVLLPRESDEK